MPTLTLLTNVKITLVTFEIARRLSHRFEMLGCRIGLINRGSAKSLATFSALRALERRTKMLECYLARCGSSVRSF